MDAGIGLSVTQALVDWAKFLTEVKGVILQFPMSVS
jgi:hypothetical protein